MRGFSLQIFSGGFAMQIKCKSHQITSKQETNRQTNRQTEMKTTYSIRLQPLQLPRQLRQFVPADPRGKDLLAHSMEPSSHSLADTARSADDQDGVDPRRHIVFESRV